MPDISFMGRGCMLGRGSIRNDWMKHEDPTPEGTMEFKLKDFDETAK